MNSGGHISLNLVTRKIILFPDLRDFVDTRRIQTTQKIGTRKTVFYPIRALLCKMVTDRIEEGDV